MTHEAPEHDLDRTGDVDPLVDACVADALSPYLGALSPEEIEDYRRLLAVFITTHPAAAPLHDRLRARPPVLSESGTVARDGAGEGQPAAEPGDGTFGGRR
ncbi:hypothetical protein WME76_03845 [Sorangium sp. So ce119]|uniref:hypothetical protein n=1 Tax=Sorangium sp. So ce119 TaxID=3133279 RepID=UPI003F5DB834